MISISNGARNSTMDKPINRRKRALLPAICFSITTGLFLVGMWPMNFSPINKVVFLHEENGVRFLGFGMAYCPSPLIGPPNTLGHNGPITLQLHIRPHSEPRNIIPRIVSFYDGKNRELLFIGQWKNDLIIRRRPTNSIDPSSYREISVNGVLTKGIKRFLTILSGQDGTRVYVDGITKINFPDFSLISEEAGNSAYLVLGNSAEGHSAWEGDLLHFSIYDRILEDKNISLHYRNLGVLGNPPNVGEANPLILYRFDEQTGTIARNQGDARYDLLIPEKFHVLKKIILALPWQSYLHFDRSFFEDVVINIFGFIPLGFFFAAWLGNKRMPKGIQVSSVILLMGCGISLTIELLQVYLPLRNSSLTDLVCNSLGTFLGLNLELFFRAPSRTAP